MGKMVKPKILNQARAEIKDQSLSSEKAFQTFNWKPKYSLSEGLAQTIHWYENHLKTQSFSEQLS